MESAEIGVNLSDHGCTLADARCHSLDRSRPDVPYSEYAGTTCLKWHSGRRASNDKAVFIENYALVQPVCVGIRADE
jgi:hypothetical protein